MSDEDLQGKAYDHRLMRRLLGYVRPYRLQMGVAALLVMGEKVVSLAGPILTMDAIDNGIRHRDLAHLDRVALLYAAMLIAQFVLGYFNAVMIQRVGQHVMLDLRTALFRQLQRLPVSFYDRNPIGRLMTRVTNDVDVLNELATAGIDALFGDLVLIVGTAVLMLRLNAELTGVTFSVLPLIAIVTLVFRSRVRVTFRDVRTRFARMNAFLNENLGGMTTVQLLNREERNLGMFREVNAGYRDANLQTVFYHAVFFSLIELLSALALGLIIWYGGRQVMWSGITLGTLVAFIQFTQRFYRPISDLSEKYGILQQAMASSERIFDLLDTPADPAAAIPAVEARGAAVEARAGAVAASADGGPNGRTDGAGTAPAIEFDRVWFAYSGENWVLRDVSFRIAPGEKVALVGATGSGKTTTISLLLRFYEARRGEIRVDGRPLRDWDPHALRQRIGLVLQDPFLFSGTIAGNIAFGNPALPREAVARAAREVSADEFIARLPGHYDAEVRERGATLSAGQRQLLAFARALALDPSILVLDEATSSVDTHTEALIQDALRRLLEGRTALVIAHRLSTIQNVNRIVVLHHGEVRESGTHETLLRSGGIYSRLYRLHVLGGETPRRPEAAAEDLSEGPEFDSPVNRL